MASSRHSSLATSRGRRCCWLRQVYSSSAFQSLFKTNWNGFWRNGLRTPKRGFNNFALASPRFVHTQIRSNTSTPAPTQMIIASSHAPSQPKLHTCHRRRRPPQPQSVQSRTHCKASRVSERQALGIGPYTLTRLVWTAISIGSWRRPVKGAAREQHATSRRLRGAEAQPGRRSQHRAGGVVRRILAVDGRTQTAPAFRITPSVVSSPSRAASSGDTSGPMRPSGSGLTASS